MVLVSVNFSKVKPIILLEGLQTLPAVLQLMSFAFHIPQPSVSASLRSGT